ncbi:hypothetical protein [Streptomyces vinaceus]|uniref:hypothetical protein n=1 Tax=Streptomyces vinaceus TaxID=1960 RepID=UPI00369C4FBE
MPQDPAPVTITPEALLVDPSKQEGYPLALTAGQGQAPEFSATVIYALPSAPNSKKTATDPGTFATSGGEADVLYIPPARDYDLFLSVERILARAGQAEAEACAVVLHAPLIAFIQAADQPASAPSSAVGPALAPGEQRQFRIADNRNKPVDAEDVNVTWRLVHGAGSIDATTGTYTAPAGTSGPQSAVIVAEARDSRNPRYDEFAVAILSLAGTSRTGS